MKESTLRDALPPVDGQPQGAVDLGRLPDRIRSVAQFWGGARRDVWPLYELVLSDGVTSEIGELRLAIAKIHDANVRAELLEWLRSRLQAPRVD
jgi:hypothetical protein